jgi:hypothetical protein
MVAEAALLESDQSRRPFDHFKVRDLRVVQGTGKVRCTEQFGALIGATLSLAFT